MSRSVYNYGCYLRHPQRWALGRFVIPVARLDEFLTALALEGSGAEPWHLTAVVSGNIAAELAAVEAFSRMGAAGSGTVKPGAVIDSVEVRVSTAEEMEMIRRHRPPETTVFFEIAPERAAELLPMAGRAGGCAKLRTGGVVAEAFPAIEAIADWLARCAQFGVPFKATAGLHHPLRGMWPLTYEAEAAETMMHGFVNLFTAAAIAWSAGHSGGRALHDRLSTCLADRERANWHFGEDAMTWSGDQTPVRIDLEALGAVRSKFARSFGSCSFEEPVGEMRELDLL
jgi:hypothetical protein